MNRYGGDGQRQPKKNEASIFFPPAKIEGARGHNECRNATRITMDMDHKPARKGGGWNEEKNPSQESVPIRILLVG